MSRILFLSIIVVADNLPRCSLRRRYWYSNFPELRIEKSRPFPLDDETLPREANLITPRQSLLDFTHKSSLRSFIFTKLSPLLFPVFPFCSVEFEPLHRRINYLNQDEYQTTVLQVFEDPEIPVYLSDFHGQLFTRFLSEISIHHFEILPFSFSSTLEFLSNTSSDQLLGTSLFPSDTILVQSPLVKDHRK